MTQADKMAALEQRIDDLHKECSELSTRRESLAIDFSAGNKSAQKECAQIDATYDAAWKERGLLMSAMEQLKVLAATTASAFRQINAMSRRTLPIGQPFAFKQQFLPQGQLGKRVAATMTVVRLRLRS